MIALTPDQEQFSIEALIRKAEGTERVIARLIPRPRFGVPKAVPHWIVSQFLQGEEATAKMCRAVRNRLKSDTARRFIDTQAQDEDHHADLYRSYLVALGLPANPSPALAAIYDRALAWDGAVEGTLLAFHVILERDNLTLQRTAARLLRCPAFNAMSAQIQRDEARHIAFGDLYLRRHLPTLIQEERLAIHAWLKALWTGAAKEIMRAGTGGFGSMAATRHREEEWRRRVDLLGAVGLFRPEERPLFQQRP